MEPADVKALVYTVIGGMVLAFVGYFAKLVFTRGFLQKIDKLENDIQSMAKGLEELRSRLKVGTQTFMSIRQENRDIQRDVRVLRREVLAVLTMRKDKEKAPP